MTMAECWRELAAENRRLAALTLFAEPFVSLAEVCEQRAAVLEAEGSIDWEDRDEAAA